MISALFEEVFRYFRPLFPIVFLSNLDFSHDNNHHDKNHHDDEENSHDGEQFHEDGGLHGHRRFSVWVPLLLRGPRGDDDGHSSPVFFC